MKVKEVYFEKLVSDGNFNNERIGIRVEVLDGNCDTALKEAIEWVENQHKGRGAHIAVYNDVINELERAQWELRSVKNDIAAAQSKWEKAKAFLEAHGIDTSSFDLPF